MRILITGSHSKISLGLKSHLQSQKHEVLTTSHLKDTTDQIEFDLNRPFDFESKIEAVFSGGIDALILCAATPSLNLSKTESIEFDEASKFISANVLGNFWLIQKALPIMKKNMFGRIIFLSSLTTQYPMKGYSVYSMAKASIENLIKTISLEYGHCNIIANNIRLGVFPTDRNEKYLNSQKVLDKLTSHISLGRLGRVEEIYPVVDCLLSSQCYIQGSDIDLGGGLTPY